MSAGNANLSGRWTGVFNYPVAWPSTSFEAVLADAGGLITGTTTEAGDTPECLGQILSATIDGRREGTTIRFAKMYDFATEHRDTVLYTGTLHPDGNEIEGRWEIPGEWSGTFLMIRNGGHSETLSQRIEEEIGHER